MGANMNRTSKLRKLIEDPGIIVVPGVYDCISAICAEAAGFNVLFTSGFGISATQLGMPDYGLLTSTEMIASVDKIINAVKIPVVADIDTGYGNPLNVTRTIKDLISRGVSGVILEDQQWPKKCGHLEGKSIIAVEEHIQKIKAARDAAAGNDMIIIGRTDARAVSGLEDAIKRGHEYRRAGADIIFIEAPKSKDEMREIAISFKGTPLFANMVEGGKTPLMSANELEDIGFKIAVYPVSGLFASTRALTLCFKYLMENKTTLGFESDFSFKEFEKFIDIDKYKLFEKKYIS